MTLAGIYCRISRDPEGTEHGVTRQETDCRELAERQGLTVHRVYVDNDISASTLSRKARPAYEEMIDDARSGAFSVILAYSNSRLTRRPRELEELLTLHENHGTRIQTVVSGNDDLSTADGRMTARIKASVDAAESERTGERLRRAFLARAQSGAPNKGRRPFGWAADKVTLDSTESALLLKAIQDVIDGRGLNAICREWNAAGIKTTAGNAWDHRGLRNTLKRHRLAGWAIHQRQIARDADGAPVRGKWEPLIDNETFQALQAALSPKRGADARPGARKYLLSGITRCGVCGARMHGAANSRGRYDYGCQRYNVNDSHAVAIDGPQTDALALAVLRTRLERESFDAMPADAPTFPKQDRLDRIPAMIGEMMDAYAVGKLSAAVTFPRVAELESEQAALLSERAAWDGGAQTVVTVKPAELERLDLDRQRAIAEQLLDAVVVAKADRRGAPFSPERVEFVWRGDR
jgi:site-specific DNA recombinase